MNEFENEIEWIRIELNKYSNIEYCNIWLAITDPAEFNVRCRSKSNLPNRTDSNAALLPYLTHQLGSAHEWSGVWNGPDSNLDIWRL